MSAKTVTALIVGTAVVVIVAAMMIATRGDDVGPRSRADDDRRVNLVMSEDRLPNQTASDWVTYSDHVVVVTATSESEIAPSQEEIDIGEGLIGRRLSLRVDEVLWSHGGADRPAPRSLSWTAFGWQFKDGSTANRTAMGTEGQPRLETGHSYLMAIEWVPPRCSPNDRRSPGQWSGLGAASIVPFDDGVIGNGEFEGRRQTASQAVRAADPADPNYTLADATAGKGAAVLIRRLDSAKPERKERYGPAPSTTPCG